jgi:hypothetical protein
MTYKGGSRSGKKVARGHKAAFHFSKLAAFLVMAFCLWISSIYFVVSVVPANSIKLILNSISNKYRITCNSIFRKIKC